MRRASVRPSFLIIQIFGFIAILFSLAVISPDALAQKKAPKRTSWVDEALRLTGESDFVRERSLKRLKARPNLKSELKSGLSSDRQALAIDVIVALKLKEFLPQLITSSKDDRDGFIHYAVYALSDSKSRTRVSSTLKNRIVNKDELSPGAKVATLDILALWRESLPVEDLLWLLSDDSPEVRMASVSFARTFLMNKNEPSYARVIERAARGEPYQLRLRAFHAAADIPKARRSSLQTLLSDCTRDKRVEVRESCPGRSRGVL